MVAATTGKHTVWSALLLYRAATWRGASANGRKAFSDNPGAQALYVRHGFQVVGRTPDRFRVDGRSLDDTSMTLNVAGVDE